MAFDLKMAVVVFDSRKVFTSKVFDSSWLSHEARVTNKLKPEAVSLMGFKSYHEMKRYINQFWHLQRIRVENTRISLIKNL